MDTAILSMMFGVALRRSEVMTLRVADVLIGTRELVIAEQKNQEHTSLPIPDWAWEKLEKYLGRRYSTSQHELLFVKRSGPNHSKHPGIGESYLKGLFKRACDYVGLPPGYSCHSARATAITHLYDSGLSTREIQPFARHANGAVTERYDKRRQDQLRRVAASLQYRKAS
jgi:integrase